MALVQDVELSFTKALDAEQSTNYLVNMILQLDDLATSLTSASASPNK